MCVDAAGRRVPAAEFVERPLFHRGYVPIRLRGRFALLCDAGTTTFGLSRRALIERVRSASALINVMGFLNDEEILASAQRRVFLDIDPGFGQMWRPWGCTMRFAATTPSSLSRRTSAARRARFRPAVSTGLRHASQWCCINGPRRQCRRPPDHQRRQLARRLWPGVLRRQDIRPAGARVQEVFARCRSTAWSVRAGAGHSRGDVADVALLRSHGWSLVTPRTCRRSLALPRLHPSLGGRALDRQGHVRRDEQRRVSDRSICYLASGGRYWRKTPALPICCRPLKDSSHSCPRTGD